MIRGRMVGIVLAFMIADIKRVLRLFRGVRSVDILETALALGWVGCYPKKGEHRNESMPAENYDKSKELLTSFSNPEPVSPPKSSGALAQPVVFDLFFNISKYVFHFGLIIYYTTCCGGSITKAEYLGKMHTGIHEKRHFQILWYKTSITTFSGI
jgi:hypothetical protein